MEKIILDTDLGCDPDDTAALSLLNNYHNKGLCKLLAVTHCRDYEYGTYAIEAINNFYKNEDIPIGAIKVSLTQRKEKEIYSKDICDKFYFGAKKNYIEAYKLIRKTLSANDNVKLVCIGPLTNIAQVLESKADEYSPLNGRELIKSKVKELVLMGGNLQNKNYIFGHDVYEIEYNIACDIGSAKKVIEDSQILTTFIDFELGYNVKSFENIFFKKTDSPIKTAFEVCGITKRESWDPVTVMYSVKGVNGLYNMSDFGYVTIDDVGKTKFNFSPQGKHRFLIENVDKAAIVEILNSQLE